MKHIALTSLLILLANAQILAQDDCNLSKKKDDFNNSVTIQTDRIDLHSHTTVHFGYGNDKESWSVKMIFFTRNNTILIGLSHNTDGGSASMISSISFKFQDGTVIVCNKPIKGIEKSGGNMNETTNTHFVITKEQLSKFASNSIDKIRIIFEYETDHPQLETELKDKITDEVKNYAACLLKELPHNASANTAVNNSGKTQGTATENGAATNVDDLLIKSGNEYYKKGDYANALIQFQKAADMGNSNAQYNVGQLYASGQGVKQDYFAALKWYQKSADQGYASAQYILGNAYYKGGGLGGIEQDYATAAKWYQKASDQGNMISRGTLGTMLYEGKGVPEDKNRGAQLIRDAANSGIASYKNYMVKNNIE